MFLNPSQFDASSTANPNTEMPPVLTQLVAAEAVRSHRLALEAAEPPTHRGTPVNLIRQVQDARIDRIDSTRARVIAFTHR
jgi:hypothetical protein